MLRLIARALVACASGAVCVLLAGVAHSSEFDPSYETHFDSSAELSRWIVNAGSWSISGGRFVDARTGPADIATVEHYDPDTIQWPTMNDDYAIDVYARVQNAGDSSVGRRSADSRTRGVPRAWHRQVVPHFRVPHRRFDASEGRWTLCHRRLPARVAAG